MEGWKSKPSELDKVIYRNKWRNCTKKIDLIIADISFFAFLFFLLIRVGLGDDEPSLQKSFFPRKKASSVRQSIEVGR